MKNKLRRRLGSGGERGVAMLELALILPIAVTLIIGVIELTEVTHRQDEIAFLAQVAGQKAFIDCLDDALLTDTTTPDNVTACIETNVGANIRDSIVNPVTGVFPGAEIIVSIYEQDAAGVVTLRGFRIVTNYNVACSDLQDNDNDGGVDFIAGVGDPDCLSADGDREDPTDYDFSKYNEARVTAELSTILQDTDNIVIAEVRYSETPLFPGFSFLTRALGGEIYAVAIF